MLSSSSAGRQMITVGGGHWEDRGRCEEDIAAERQRDECEMGAMIGLASLSVAKLQLVSRLAKV